MASLQEIVNTLNTYPDCCHITPKRLGTYLESAAEAGGVTPIRSVIKDKLLYITGAEQLLEKGYKPVLLRYVRKHNRLRLHGTTRRTHGATTKGWQLYGNAYTRTVNADGLVSFSELHPTACCPEDLVNASIVMLDESGVESTSGTTPAIRVAFGQRKHIFTNRRRFRFGLLFVDGFDIKKGLLRENIKSSMAEFKLLVWMDINSHVAYSLSL